MAVQTALQVVRVELGDRAYPIYIGPFARGMLRFGNIAGVESRQTIIIADEHVAGLHAKALTEAIGEPVDVVQFPAGEASKSLSTAARLYERLAEARLERGGLILALGGGVTGDLAGFVAATWLRGIRFAQVPTSLLAAIDASVGGKTGVNLPAGKNLVGAFHQPVAVVVDTDFLETLPPREFTAGLAESVKHAVVRDPDFLAWHEARAVEISTRQPEALSSLIAWNCRIKAEVVAQDERESGLRAILNHGHTIGHALEHLLEYELRHGECVALGMRVENELARVRGQLPAADAERIRVLLDRLGLPGRLPAPLPAADVIRACRLDKKVQAGAIHFVLLAGIGRPARVADVTDEEIARALLVIQPA